VWFNETSDMSQRDNYKLLVYASSLLNIFDIEYLKARNATRGGSVIELE